MKYKKSIGECAEDVYNYFLDNFNNRSNSLQIEVQKNFMAAGLINQKK